MKTAVEWLETRAEEREKNNPNESAYWHLKQLQKDFEQAKEIEKEQSSDKLYSKEEVLEHLNILIMMSSSKLDEFTNDEEMVTIKWFEQFKKK
jgi:RPA family protein